MLGFVARSGQNWADADAVEEADDERDVNEVFIMPVQDSDNGSEKSSSGMTDDMQNVSMESDTVGLANLGNAEAAVGPANPGNADSGEEADNEGECALFQLFVVGITGIDKKVLGV